MQATNGVVTQPGAPPPGTSRWQQVSRAVFDARAFIWFAAIALLPLAWSFKQQEVVWRESVVSAVIHVAGLSFWALYLRRCGLQTVWTSVVLFGFASVVATSPLGAGNASAVGEAVFLYVLVSLFSAYERQPNLQAIASAALLMSAGVLTKPPVAISCAFLSITMFVFHRRRAPSGSVTFALLMFTPTALCLTSAILLVLVAGDLLGGSVPASGELIAQGATIFPRLYTWVPATLAFSDAGIRWLVCPVAVVLYRLCIKRIAACDFAFGLMLLGATLLNAWSQIPQPLGPADVFYLAMGGGAALLAQSPPTSYIARAAISASFLAAAYWPVI